MQQPILLLLIVLICPCFGADRPKVEYSTLNYYSDQSGDYLLSFGGLYNEVVSSDLWRFSLRSSTWEQMASNGSPSLYQHSAVIRTISNTVLVFSILIPNLIMYEYFPANNTWRILNDNFLIATDHSASYIESLDALLIFGTSDTSQANNDLQYYFLSNKTLSTIPAQNPIARHSLVRAAWMPETTTLYSIGGLNVSNLAVINRFVGISLAKNNDSWDYLPSIEPSADSVLIASYPYVYAYGGCRQFRFQSPIGVICSNISSEIMKYNVETREWTIVDTHIMRTESVGVLTPNRVLYIFGGTNQEQVIGGLTYFDLSETVVRVESEENEEDRVGVIVASVIVGVAVLSGLAGYIVYRRRNGVKDALRVPLVSKTNV